MSAPLDSTAGSPAVPGSIPGPSDAWFRSVVEAANEGIWIIDLDGLTIFANERMATMLGTTPEAMIGRPPFEFLDEDDRSYAAGVIAQNFEGIPVQFEIRFRRADGGEMPVLGGSAPLRDDHGRITGSVATFSDLTERRASEQEARETATLFLKLLESSSDAIWMRDPEGVFQIANPAAARVLGGTSDSDLVVGRNMTDLWGPEFASLLSVQTEELFRSGKGEIVEEEVFDSSREGKAVFLSNKVPLYNQDGSPLGVLGVSRDITDLKRVENELRENQSHLAAQIAELRVAQQREHLLAREVDHRAKNLLAVVQSVVQLSRARTVDELKEGLTGRIQALARAHSILADARWEGVDLTQLAEEELAPFVGDDPGRVRRAGPPVLLRPAAAQSLALVLHELMTNAAKYGALSTPAGTLLVEWRVDESNLILTWVESGGDKVAAPTDSGFGSRLITTSIERQLRGQVERQWTESGLHCTFRIPLDHAVVDTFS